MILRLRHLLLLPGALTILFLMSGGCGTPPPPTTGDEVVWYGKVQTLIQENCQNCHYQGGVGPFPLTTLEEVKAKAALVKWSVENRRMPPWMPTENQECKPFEHSIALSEEQIKTITTWVDSGTPAGDPAKATTYQDKRDQLANIDVEVGAQAPHTPDGKSPDDYHCFLTQQAIAPDAGNKELIGFQLIPGVREMVHHVLIYRVDAAFGEELAQQHPNKNWPCYTGALFNGDAAKKAGLLGVWVPGTDVLHFPQDTGLPMKAGDYVMLEIHYNLNTLDKPLPDQTKIRLEFARKPVKHQLQLMAHTETKLRVPPGAKNFDVSNDTGEIPLPGTLWGLMPHMHKYGKRFKTVMTKKKDGSKVCLVDIPRWDYNWQQTFFFKQPIPIDLNDSVLMTCTFDNPTDKDITWGDRTEDEMCLNFYFVSIP